MTDRFAKLAWEIRTEGLAGLTDRIVAALRAVDAEAEKRGNKAGQEAMRERAAGVADGHSSNDPDVTLCAALIAQGVRALPIEEPTP